MENKKNASIEMLPVCVAIAILVLVIVIGFGTGAFQKLIPNVTDKEETKMLYCDFEGGEFYDKIEYRTDLTIPSNCVEASTNAIIMCDTLSGQKYVVYDDAIFIERYEEEYGLNLVDCEWFEENF